MGQSLDKDTSEGRRGSQDTGASSSTTSDSDRFRIREQDTAPRPMSQRPSTTSRWQSGSPLALSPLQRHAQDLERQVQELKTSLRSQEKEFKAQLSEKDGEIAELKKSLCLYDECSEADIINRVDGINTRIQSLSRSLAVKWVKEASKSSAEKSHGNSSASVDVNALGKVIGTQLVDALQGVSLGQKTFAPVYLQLAWQAVIVAIVNGILESFSATLSSNARWVEVEGVLRATSNAVKSAEVQPAYGRWRLLTHRYLRQVLLHEDKAVQTYVDHAVWLCYQAAQLVLKDLCPDDRSFSKGLRDQTQEIIEESFKLLTAMQESVVTANYQPFILSNGRTFRPENMTVSKLDKPYEKDFVVCTIGLGITCSGKKGRENSSESTGSILKLPQVLTECNLNDMIADM